DMGLVRLEPDAESVWRVYPGVQFTPTRAMLPVIAKPAAEAPAVAKESSAEPSVNEKMTPAEEQPQPDATAAPPARQPRRRTYRRRSRKGPAGHDTQHPTA